MTISWRLLRRRRSRVSFSVGNVAPGDVRHVKPKLTTRAGRMQSVSGRIAVRSCATGQQ
jgi:hypothetical protein